MTCVHEAGSEFGSSVNGQQQSLTLVLNSTLNGLNPSIKKHRMAEWIKKREDSTISCPQKTNFRSKDTYRLEVKGWNMIFHAN